MYRIVATTCGNVIFIKNNGTTEIYSGKNLNDYEGTTEVDINTTTDADLAKIAERQIKRRA